MAETIPDTSSHIQSTPYLRSWRLVIVITALCLGIFLYGLDVNIIGVAIPSITTEFGSLSDVSWYGSAYLLTVTAFQPGFGNLYKYFNAKIVYLVSLVVFEIGSAVSAASPSSAVLVFGRALLGVGAAGLLQGALAIIGYVVPLEKVPAFQGIVVSAMGISVCIGPVIGGAITEYVKWRWCFWINVPAGAVVILIVFLFVPIPPKSSSKDRVLPLGEKLRRMDAGGTVLFIGAICCLLMALTWGGQTYAWNDSKIIGLFIGFGLISLCFLYWIWKRGDAALIPLRVLRKRSIYMGAITLFGIGMAVNIYGYYLPIYFQSAQGVSATMSGVNYIAMILPQIVTLGVTGAIVTKWGYYVPYMIAGDIIACVGAGLLTRVGVFTPTAEWAAYLVITGFGIGMAYQLPYTAVQAVLDPVDVPTGNAIAVFSSQVSGVIGLAIGQDLLIHELRSSVPRYTDAVSVVEVIAVGAMGFVDLAPSTAVLEALRHAYADAVRLTLVLALASTCVAFPASWAMEWLNIKQIAEKRRHAQESFEQGEPGHEQGEPGHERGSSSTDVEKAGYMATVTQEKASN